MGKAGLHRKFAIAGRREFAVTLARMSTISFAPHGPATEGFTDGADGTRIHYEIWTPPHGVAPADTLVLSDGIGCDGYAWKYLAAHFSKTYRIIHWQYRGHGRSGLPHERTRTSFDDICGDLEAVMKATHTPTAIFIGHSMGVQVCLEYHRRHPDAVKALVLICGSHGYPLDTFHDTNILRTVVPALLRTAVRFPSFVETAWRTLCSNELTYQLATHFEVNGRLIAREDFAPYFDHLAGLDPQLFLSMLKNASEHSAYTHLPHIRVPSLIVAGTADGFTPHWLSEEMHDHIPGSELLTIPGGTHTAPIEHPELLELRLEKFLNRLTAPAQQARASTV